MVSFEQLSYEKQSESERATPAVKNKKKVDFTQFLKSLRLQLGTFLICGRDENEPIRVSQSTYLILHLVRTRNDAVDLAYGTYSSISPNNIYPQLAVCIIICEATSRLHRHIHLVMCYFTIEVLKIKEESKSRNI